MSVQQHWIDSEGEVDDFLDDLFNKEPKPTMDKITLLAKERVAPEFRDSFIDKGRKRLEGLR